MHLWHWTLVAAVALISVFAAAHALLWKRDPRAAIGWILVCLFLPLAGAVLYFTFGINRIRTRARKYDARRLRAVTPSDSRSLVEPESSAVAHEYGGLVQVSDSISTWPLVRGNEIELLHNGEEAYPQMLEAIDAAGDWVYLSTYLFETNRTGRDFIERLAAAVERGVDVRVLVDGLGELYSRPRASRLLRRRGVRVARFLPPKLLPPTIHVNLRNHRKILVVDGRVAFTGGMNLGDRHVATEERPRPVTDMHFKVTGPIVDQIQAVFLNDWRFTTRDPSTPPPRPSTVAGDAICRCLVDGPNEDIDRLVTALVGAVSAAQQSVWIVTPYFLPPRELIAALRGAALRGVEVTVILPAENNLRYVHWATMNLLWELLERGVRIHFQPAPFAHTKLFVVDNRYTQIGSANIDPRSLRLNFELTVEVFDDGVAGEIVAYCRELLARSREVTLAEVDGRPLHVRLRDSIAWLASPYL